MKDMQVTANLSATGDAKDSEECLQNVLETCRILYPT
jgi:hypothetical protein